MFRNRIAIAVLLSIPAGLTGACTAPEVEDDLAGELADEGEEGKADGDGTFTYYEIRPDYRRCAAPLCGGYHVSRVNRAKTRCADGKMAASCYVAELDASALGFSPADLDALRSGIADEAVVVRGSVERQDYPEFGNLGRFVATEAWRAGTDSSPDGVWVLVEPNGVRCFAPPCEDKAERKLNSTRSANIADLDFEPSGATPEQIDLAWGELTTGLIVVGDRYRFQQDGRRAKARTVTQFYTRMLQSGDPTQGECFVGGCSGQICSDRPDVITTCEWREEYACYQGATCERQADGACGWTSTPELDACLAQF